MINEWYYKFFLKDLMMSNQTILLFNSKNSKIKKKKIPNDQMYTGIYSVFSNNIGDH
jgi:hypothetical protein